MVVNVHIVDVCAAKYPFLSTMFRRSWQNRQFDHSRYVLEWHLPKQQPENRNIYNVENEIAQFHRENDRHRNL